MQIILSYFTNTNVKEQSHRSKVQTTLIDEILFEKFLKNWYIEDCKVNKLQCFPKALNGQDTYSNI